MWMNDVLNFVRNRLAWNWMWTEQPISRVCTARAPSLTRPDHHDTARCVMAGQIFTAERYKSSGRTYLYLASIHSSQRQDKAVLRVQDEEGYHCSEVWLAGIVMYVFGVHWFPDLVLLLHYEGCSCPGECECDTTRPSRWLTNGIGLCLSWGHLEMGIIDGDHRLIIWG